MTTQELAIKAVESLKAEYPDALCSLDYEDPLQLLISVRLAAQCTDARVNLVTPALFERFPTLEAFCEGTEEEIGELIHSCGFFRAKARDILGACKKIRDDFGGKVPDNMEDLLSLPGVGRKTANLILYPHIREAGAHKEQGPREGGAGPVGGASPRGVQ